ncbi:MAG: 30S ribosomal protein THX [Betaproteobacteria bacterium]|jgi:30S ribosomal protein S31
MGAGDSRTRRGKIAIGSYGKTRPHDRKKPAPAAATPVGRPAGKPRGR